MNNKDGPDIDKIKRLVKQLADANSTQSKMGDVFKFIENNFKKFQSDYDLTSQKTRYSTGKLEKRLFTLLADLCKWNNGKENAKTASMILYNCGYKSYKTKEKRFRQKVENEKKKIKQNDKSSASPRYTKQVSLHKTSLHDDMEDSYSENNDDAKDCYFPKNKVINCRQNRQHTFNADNPLHIIDNTETPTTRSKDTRKQEEGNPNLGGSNSITTINNMDANKEAAVVLNGNLNESPNSIKEEHIEQTNVYKFNSNYQSDYFSHPDRDFLEMLIVCLIIKNCIRTSISLFNRLPHTITSLPLSIFDLI